MKNDTLVAPNPHFIGLEQGGYFFFMGIAAEHELSVRVLKSGKCFRFGGEVHFHADGAGNICALTGFHHTFPAKIVLSLLFKKADIRVSKAGDAAPQAD